MFPRKTNFLGRTKTTKTRFEENSLPTPTPTTPTSQQRPSYHRRSDASDAGSSDTCSDFSLDSNDAYSQRIVELE